MKNIAFIVNGKISFQGRLKRQIHRAFPNDYKITIYVTEPDVNGITLTSRAINEGSTHIICVGGDGTLNEVANGVMESRKTLSEGDSNNLRMGVLPHGTGNDFAKSINVKFNLTELKERIDQDQFNVIDLGLVKFQNLSGHDASRYFINIVDVGIGGIVSKRVNKSPKWIGAFAAYQLAIIRSLISYRHQAIKASADTKIYTGRVLNYIVANGKYFGSGLGIAPDARPDDGMFALVIIGKVSLGFYLKSLSDIKKSKHIKHPHVFYEEAREVNIESEKPLPIDMDGEYVGNTPMRVRMVEKAIRFIR